MPSAGIEPTIPASERLQTHDLDCAANGIYFVKIYFKNVISIGLHLTFSANFRFH